MNDLDAFVPAEPPAFGRDHELGKGGRVKARVAKRERARTVARIAAKVNAHDMSELAARERWAEELDRIVIGERYTIRPYVHVGCEKCEPARCAACGREQPEAARSWCCDADLSRPAPCFSARTTASTVVRVHELVSVDERLGPLYRVTMVKPTLWQLRIWIGAFAPDKAHLEQHPEKWHTVPMVMASRDFGGRAPSIGAPLTERAEGQ